MNLLEIRHEKCLVSFHPGNFEPATDGKWVDDPMTGDSTDRKVGNLEICRKFVFTHYIPIDYPIVFNIFP